MPRASSTDGFCRRVALVQTILESWYWRCASAVCACITTKLQYPTGMDATSHPLSYLVFRAQAKRVYRSCQSVIRSLSVNSQSSTAAFWEGVLYFARSWSHLFVDLFIHLSSRGISWWMAFSCKISAQQLCLTCVQTVMVCHLDCWVCFSLSIFRVGCQF